MTVADLLAELSRFPGNRKVFATWEGIFRSVSVYTSRDGHVIIDADDDFYRKDIESGQKKPQ